MIDREMVRERVAWLVDWVNSFDNPVERMGVAADTINELLDSDGVLAQLGEIRRMAAFQASPEALRDAGIRPQVIARLRTEGRRLTRIAS